MDKRQSQSMNSAPRKRLAQSQDNFSKLCKNNVILKNIYSLAIKYFPTLIEKSVCVVPFDAARISTIRDLREFCEQVSLSKDPLS